MAENMNLITGYQGEPHVTAADDGIINAAIFGKNAYILNIGEKLRAEIVSNNQIRIYDGAVSVQGRIARVETSNYVDLTIDTGSQGMKRNDLVCVRYEKDAETLVETCNLVVIKGTEDASAPVDPDYADGDIFAGDLVAESPVYRVKVNGINIEGIEQIAVEVDCIDAIVNNPNFHNNIIFDGGKQTGVRGLRLKNNADDATPSYAHDAAIIGGSPSSDTAITIWDYKNNRRAFSYADDSNKITIGNGDATLIDIQGKVKTGDFHSNISWDTSKVKATVGSQIARRFDFMGMNYVSFYCQPKIKMLAHHSYIIGTIPQGYRPVKRVIIPMIGNGDMLIIYDTGAIELLVGNDDWTASGDNYIRAAGFYMSGDWE